MLLVLRISVKSTAYDFVNVCVSLSVQSECTSKIAKTPYNMPRDVALCHLPVSKTCEPSHLTTPLLLPNELLVLSEPWSHLLASSMVALHECVSSTKKSAGTSLVRGKRHNSLRREQNMICQLEKCTSQETNRAENSTQN
jgi:hypothetical protein